jgi:predicted acetyltransferase
VTTLLPHPVLIPATRDDIPRLRHLMQFYSYDFSDLVDLDVNEDGSFADKPWDEYWVDDWRHAFLIRVDKKLAGFVLVHERSRFTGKGGVFDMAEFFVLKKYRKRGIGRGAAFACFDRFRGDWEIRQRSTNVAATAFWRRVIARYTHGSFKEIEWNDSSWVGPVQFFSSRARNAETDGA